MRSLIEGVLAALRAIRRNMLRAALTVLGILIGVMAVVSSTALGLGARDEIGNWIASLGSNFIVVFPMEQHVSGAHSAHGGGHRLNEEDARIIQRDAVSVKALTPWLGAPGQVVADDANWSTFIGGTTTEFQEIKNWHVDHGTMWNEHDEATKAKVVVIGKTVATKLFGTNDPIGRQVRVGRYPFQVIGQLEEKGKSPLGDDQDDVVLMPIGSMRARILKTPPGFVGVLLVSATAPETTEHAVSEIQSILRQRHNIPDDANPDFGIETLKEIQEKQQTIFLVLTGVLGVVAFISLVVGGIGVMNIMLVSVTERTREIGIRMAIGAREADIRTQFLVEAVVLSFIGGLAGVAVGWAVIAITSKAIGWHLGMNPIALTLALGVTALVGIGFGFFPARKAAKMDPINALRHE